MDYGASFFIPNGTLKEDRLYQEEAVKKNAIRQFMDEIELGEVYTFRMTREERFDTLAYTPGRHIAYRYEIHAVPEITLSNVSSLVVPLPPHKGFVSRIRESIKYIVKG
jgi:hypothetical protein